jgi:HEPN domain-containing protein
MRRSHSDPEIEAYIRKAERDLATAHRMAEEGEDYADIICFHAEQCAEKSLKALLLAFGQAPPRTHDLVLVHRTIASVEPDMAEAVQFLGSYPNIELIWASPRELLNIFHAESTGCHIITVTNDVLKKLPLIGKDLDEYSLDTVKMFYEDGRKAGYCL